MKSVSAHKPRRQRRQTRNLNLIAPSIVKSKNPSSKRSFSPMSTALCCDLVGSTAKQQPGSGLAADSVSRDKIFREAKQRLEDRARDHMQRFGATPASIHSIADNFSGAFDNPEHALVCALVLQRSLLTHPILLPQGEMRIRIGLHTGVSDPGDPSYLGDPGNVAARMHAYAPPGGVAASARAKENCGGLEAIEWISLGKRKPKGLYQAIHVFEARCSPEALLQIIPRMIERAAQARKPHRKSPKPRRPPRVANSQQITVGKAQQVIGIQNAITMNNNFSQNQSQPKRRPKRPSPRVKVKIGKVKGQAINGPVRVEGDQIFKFNKA